MKKILPLIVLGVIVLACYSWVKGFNNKAVTLEEGIKQQWGNVQTTYQRRNDLIGNLVNTVKGAADFEKNTLEAVIKARSEATKTTIDPSNITPEQLEQFNQTQSGLSGALSRMLLTVERYPDLKANENFLKLKDQLESTENQILTARTRFNEATRPYNDHVRQFPNSILAGIFNFSAKPYFDAVAGAEKPVDVNFDFN